MNYGGIVLFQLILVYDLKMNNFEILICGILKKNLYFVVMLSLFKSGKIHARELTFSNFWFNNQFSRLLNVCLIFVGTRVY